MTGIRRRLRCFSMYFIAIICVTMPIIAMSAASAAAVSLSVGRFPAATYSTVIALRPGSAAPVNPPPQSVCDRLRTLGIWAPCRLLGSCETGLRLVRRRGRRAGRRAKRQQQQQQSADQPRPWPPSSPSVEPSRPDDVDDQPAPSCCTAAAPALYVLNAAALAKPHAIQQLTADLASYDVDVAVITETHLKAKHSDSVVSIP